MQSFARVLAVRYLAPPCRSGMYSPGLCCSLLASIRGICSPDTCWHSAQKAHRAYSRHRALASHFVLPYSWAKRERMALKTMKSPASLLCMYIEYKLIPWSVLTACDDRCYRDLRSEVATIFKRLEGWKTSLKPFPTHQFFETWFTCRLETRRFYPLVEARPVLLHRQYLLGLPSLHAVEDGHFAEFGSLTRANATPCHRRGMTLQGWNWYGQSELWIRRFASNLTNSTTSILSQLIGKTASLFVCKIQALRWIWARSSWYCKSYIVHAPKQYSEGLKASEVLILLHDLSKWLL